MQRPRPDTKQYDELIDDFTTTHDFKELAQKYKVDIATIYRWFSNEGIANSRRLLIRQKQQINFNLYYDKLPAIIKERLKIAQSVYTDSEVRRKIINDILEDAGQRTKQPDQTTNVKVQIGPEETFTSEEHAEAARLYEQSIKGSSPGKPPVSPKGSNRVRGKAVSPGVDKVSDRKAKKPNTRTKDAREK